VTNPAKTLPRVPTPAMQEAMEQHFRKWQKILGYSDTQMKALCWDAMQAYYCMWDSAPDSYTAKVR